MATVSDITTTPLSGLNHIDALLDTGPDWNYLTPAGNTLYYTFSVLSGNEAGQTGQEGFTLVQQTAARKAFTYITELTGIQFVEAVNGTDAQIHLCNTDLQGANVTGLCSWHSSYTYSGTNVVSYEADAYVYLDNVEWFSQNRDLNPGGYGYETLLHELGHALGLKHPFDDSIHLPSSQDNTNNTLMSYTSAGGPHSTYGQYDIAALKWLYGTDGLGGALGINSTTGARYITGTSGTDTLTGTGANDTLEGDGGNDMIDGGSGTDTAVFRGVRSNYTVNALSNGNLQVVSSTDGTDTLSSIEVLKFQDMSVSRADAVAAATQDKLTVVVATNAFGYSGQPYGNTPQVSGKADPGTVVNVYSAADNKLVGTATANKYGMYFIEKLSAFPDGVNQVYATESDTAGHLLLTTTPVSFIVDTTPPVKPTYSVNYTAGSNQATLNGTAEAGTTIALMRTGDLQKIAHTTVAADGTWHLETSPLLNGSYTVRVVSLDHGDNGTNAATSPTWTVNSSANLTGTSGKDVLTAGAGNNAIDGGGGIDTVVYAGSRASFDVKQADWGFDVTDHAGSNGHDALINVERIQFDDGYVAIDNNAASIYRLYSAAFGRASDAGGMGFWISAMDNGYNINQIALSFMTGQPEFDQKYGTNPSDDTFVMQLYHNVLGRDPDASGYDFWMNALANTPESNKAAMRAQLLIDFSNGPENVAKVVGQLEHGVDYVPHI
jgi:Ca2+-binding RTX toxin-like protein